MTENPTKRFFIQLKSTSMLIAIATLTSSFTLWLVESPVKYVLFIFEIFVTVTVYFTLNSNDREFGSFRNRLGTISMLATKIFSGLYASVLLVSSSLVLILLNTFHVDGTQSIQLLLSFLTASFLVGYSLLNIFKIDKYLSRLEVIVLSYLTSFIFSGFSTLVLVSFDEKTRGIVIPLLFILIGLCSLIQHIKSRSRDSDSEFTTHSLASLCKNTDLLAIGLALTFYVIFYYFTYPNFTYIPGSDISRHFSDSVILSRSPDLYAGHTTYILFHAFEAAFYTLAGSPQQLAPFQSIQVLLNLFLPISVYILAKRFFGRIDMRIPGISTILYAISSNFSFVYFAQLKLLNTTGIEAHLLGAEVAERSFNGTVNFLQPFPWFVPLSVSFVLFVAAVLLLGAREMPRRKFVPLFTIIILAMYLTHSSEAVIFVVLIAAYSFVSKKGDSIRLNEALYSSLLSFIFAAAFVILYTLIWTSALTTSSIPLNVMISLISPTLFVSAALLWRLKISRDFDFASKFIRGTTFYSILSNILVVVYLIGFITWVFNETFTTSSIYDTGVAPWFVYPLMLGIVGLLAVLAIRYFPNVLPNNNVRFIVASILIFVALGKILSLININLFITGYWEKRLLFYIFLFACLLAPWPLLKFRTQIDTKVWTKTLKNASVMTMVSLIILLGFSSMILQSVYWFSTTQDSSHLISGDELEAIKYLKTVLERDSHAFVITATNASKMNLAFAAPAYQFSLSNILFSSKFPEVPLMVLNAHNLDHAYIYVHQRDSSVLKSESWFTDHLLPMLPIIFSNGEVTILNATHYSSPVAKSDTSLLIPIDYRDNSWLYGYDILSQSGKNYTVMYDKDASALKSKNVILGFDPNPYYSYHDGFSSENNREWKNRSGTWEFSRDGLRAGDKSNAVENVILSPVMAQNVNISTSFRISTLDPTVANYVSIVNSWLDERNYQYAGITIFNDVVYVSFATVNDGKLSFNPAWPGMKTDLRWNPNTRFNMTLSIDGNRDLEQLSLNGTQYLRQEYHGISGHLGLSYGHVQDVVFNSFDIEDAEKLNLRDLPDYLKYVNSGGHLFVLNTNGYGSIANYLNILQKEEENLNSGKGLPLSGISQNGGRNNTQSPVTNSSNIFKTLKTESLIGHGKITYLNIHSVISDYLENKIGPRTQYQFFKNLSQLLPLQPYESSPPSLKDVPVIFKGLNANGGIILKTASVIFPSGTQLKEARIDSGNSTFSVENITGLDMQNFYYANLTSHNMSMTAGNGMYSDLLFKPFANSTVTITFSPITTTEIFAASGQDKLIHVSNVSKISLMNIEPFHIYVRQPTLEINNGNVSLDEFYPLELYSKGKLGSPNVMIHGNVMFSVLMSDSYALLSHFQVDGTAQRVSLDKPIAEPLLPPITISKMYSLPPFVRVLTLLPFLIAAVLIVLSRSEVVRPFNKIR
jgi:hypothetical protein